MADLVVAHTGQLDAATLADVRALLVDAFDGDFGGSDWEHCLGGMHALQYDDGRLVGHAALVQRRLLHHGRALRAGYVEGLAVATDYRRRGRATALLDALEELSSAAYDLAALSATAEGAALYESRGWRRWRGRTSVLTPSGVLRTPEDDGAVYVLPHAASLDLDGELTCDWRDGDAW